MKNRYYVIVVDGDDGTPRTLRNDYEGCLYIYSDLALAEQKVSKINKQANPRLVVLHDIRMDSEATELFYLKK